MKIIVNGKLYNTETATLIAEGEYISVYRTRKGNWFKKTRVSVDGCKIDPITDREAQTLVGIHDPDEYEKYFGRAEEA